MIQIPEGLQGKELIAFLFANKADLIKQKCAFPTKSESSNWPYSVTKKSTAKKLAALKDDSDDDILVAEEKELDVAVIANAANWLDSQLDLLVPDCWKKTIKENGPAGKDRIWHLKNHKQNTDGVIGKIKSLYSEEYSLKDLGIQNMVGTTQCLVMESQVKRTLDPKCYEMYASKMINQHSIGLHYVKIELAINDSNYPEEFAIWNKYFMSIINKDVATKVGYFWVVLEIKLMEVSAVLWGANEITPTIDSEDKNQPDKSTDENKDEPPTGTQPSVSEMIDKMEFNINL